MSVNSGSLKLLSAAGVVGLAVVTIAGCSSSSTSTASTSPSASSASPSTATASPTSSSGLCTTEAILKVLPTGASMVKFNCENVAGTEWAAVKVNPGPTVFFLQAKKGTWQVSTADQVCGTASAGLPPKLLDYCTDTSPTSSKSASPKTS